MHRSFLRIMLATVAIAAAHCAMGAPSVSQAVSTYNSSGATSLSPSAITPAAGDSLVIAVFTEYGPCLTAGGASFSLSDNQSNTYNLIGLNTTYTGGETALTFTAGPGSGATSATLTANFSGTSGGNYVIQFSDNEIRRATLTNGSTSVTWTGGLSATVGTAATAWANSGGFVGFWLATNVPANSTTVTASASSACIYAVRVEDATGVATSGTFLGFSVGQIDSPGSGANAISSGTVTVSQSALVIGLGATGNSSGSNTPTAGSGFTSVSGFNWNDTSYTTALDEYQVVSSSTAATFTAPSGSTADNYGAVAIALAATAPSSSGITGFCNLCAMPQWQTTTSNLTLSGLEPAVLCNASSGAVTITLPTAVGNFNEFRVVKSDSSSNACTLATTSSQTINGAATQSTTTQWAGWTVRSDNSNWEVAH